MTSNAEVLTATEIAQRIREVHDKHQRLATAAAAHEAQPLVRALYKVLLRAAIKGNDAYQLEFCKRRAMLRHEIEYHAYGHSIVDADKINARAAHWQKRMARIRARKVH